MNAKMKKVLFIFGGIAAALVLAAVIFVLTFNINSYKPRIETAVSLATGMKVRINGTIKLTLFPRASVSFENIQIQNRDADVASIKKVEAEIRLLPLLLRDVHVQQVRLITPAFFITKNKNGHFSNIETPVFVCEKKIVLFQVFLKEIHRPLPRDFCLLGIVSFGIAVVVKSMTSAGICINLVFFVICF